MTKKTIISSAIFALLNFNIFATNSADAAVWQVISSESNKRIELDKSTLNKNDGYIETLGRVVFYKPLKDVKSGEEYRMIEAVTRYNCEKRTASTIKRIYRRNENSVLREEILNAAELPVRGGTLDDKMLSQVCRMADISNNNPSPITAPTAVVNQNKATQTDNQSNAGKNNKNLVENSQNTKKSKKELARETKETKKTKETKETKEKNLAKQNKTQTQTQIAKNNKQNANANASKNNKNTVSAKNKNNKFDENLPLLPTVDVIKNTNSNSPFVPKQVDWSYNGASNPAHWADIKPEYKICRNGLRQSPIDIRGSVKGDLEELKFNYQSTPFKIVDTGYTIRAELENGGNLYYEGKSWNLKALEFRIPGEEMINGKRGEMSVQLQHQSITGEMLIISIQLNRGAENMLIQQIWNNMPLERNRAMKSVDEPIKKEINVKHLLPTNIGYITYMGSLTTPPCTENVQWVVLRTPQTISDEQIKSFSFLYQNNARPLQSDNGRMIKESR